MSPAGRKVLIKFEGERLSTYHCSAGVPTIGVGHTSAAGPPRVTPGLTITPAESAAILSRDLVRFEGAVDRLVRVDLNQNQFDALVCFVFNLGEGAFAGSTLLRKVNAGDFAGAAQEFPRWNKANKKVVAGLTTRRAAEAKLFSTPV